MKRSVADNNAVENALRIVSMDRKNILFFGSARSDKANYCCMNWPVASTVLHRHPVVIGDKTGLLLRHYKEHYPGNRATNSAGKQRFSCQRP
ncbi:IS66 family transposase [Serratia liquefaciens]|uniref:IS66 family transposase n=1 Tax=Serratia liquefaciens TaxID=614 RepID=UPI001A91658B